MKKNPLFLIASILALLAGTSYSNLAFAAAPTCDGSTATLYVDASNIIQDAHGGPLDGQTYTAGVTVLNGASGPTSVVIVGTDAADIIVGNFVGDVICGGAGDDTITINRDGTSVFGEDGNDTITDNGGAGSVTMSGGNGDDYIEMRRPGTANGDAGNDDIITYGFAGSAVVNGGGDDDYIEVRSTGTFHGDTGRDLITIKGTFAGTAMIYGDEGDDQLFGLSTEAADFRGGDNNDLICAGDGSTVDLYGEAGNDILSTLSRFGAMTGGTDTDSCYGTSDFGVSFATCETEDTTGSGAPECAAGAPSAAEWPPAPPTNTAPSTPSISGTNAGDVGVTYSFDFTATDAADQIRYGIDWDDNSTVDEWVPVTGYVSSGVTQSGSNSWSPASSYTFQALAEDDEGLQSGWGTHAITISDATTLFYDGGEDWTHDVECGVGHPWDVCDATDGYTGDTFVRSVNNTVQAPAVGSWYIAASDIDGDTDYLEVTFDSSMCSDMTVDFYASNGPGLDLGEEAQMLLSNGVVTQKVYDSMGNGVANGNEQDGLWHSHSVDVSTLIGSNTTLTLKGMPTGTRDGNSEWNHWDEIRVWCNEGTVTNNPPERASVTGPVSGDVSTSYGFGFQSTDPDTDNIRYGVDWNNDGLVVIDDGDEWLPSSGYVTSGTQVSTTHSWSTTGSYTFGVLTEDIYGAFLPSSSFEYHSIDIGGCASVIDTFPHSESFESGFGDWVNAITDDIDWRRNSGSTGSSGTGPTSASDLSMYVYTEASTGDNGSPYKTAILESPCLDISSLSNPAFSFDYHMLGTNMGTLKLQVSTDGTVWSDLWSETGTQGDVWNTHESDLSAYTSEASIKLRFVGTTGDGWSSDMAFDNLMLVESGGGNTAPEIPTITGDASGNYDAIYSFDFQATDAESDPIRYGIDWDMSGSVDEWVPSSGWVAAGTSQSKSKWWSYDGVKSFQVLTQDDRDGSSAWATHNITLSTPNITPSGMTVSGPSEGESYVAYDFDVSVQDLVSLSGDRLDSTVDTQEQGIDIVYDPVLGEYVVLSNPGDVYQTNAMDMVAYTSTDLDNWSRYDVDAAADWQHIQEFMYEPVSGTFAGTGYEWRGGGTYCPTVWDTTDVSAGTWNFSEPMVCGGSRHLKSILYNYEKGVYVTAGYYWTSNYEVAIWESSDLSNWTQHNVVSGANHEYVMSMLYDSAGETYILGGSVSNGSDRDMAVWVASSTSPTSWTQYVHSPSSSGDQAIYRGIHDTTNGNYIFVGSDSGLGSSDAVLWVSNNLQGWSEITIEGGVGTQSAYDIFYDATSSKYIVSGERFNGVDQDSVLWTSTNLVDWDRHTIDVGPGNQSARSFIKHPTLSDTYVAVGTTVDDVASTTDIVVWEVTLPDQVRYGFDWDSNNSIDEWLPASGYVSSGAEQTMTKFWTTDGVKSFQVRAEDDGGALSSFASHVITITNDGSLAAPTNLQTEGLTDPVDIATGTPALSAEYVSGTDSYYREVTITNTLATTLTDFQVEVSVDTSTLIADEKMAADCGDIHFTDSSGSTAIPHWFEQDLCDAADTPVWIKVPTVTASGATVVRMYYGDSATGVAPDGDSVFIFFDDFEDQDFAEWDTSSGWTTDTAQKKYGSYAAKSGSTWGEYLSMVLSPLDSGVFEAWYWYPVNSSSYLYGMNPHFTGPNELQAYWATAHTVKALTHYNNGFYHYPTQTPYVEGDWQHVAEKFDFSAGTQGRHWLFHNDSNRSGAGGSDIVTYYGNPADQIDGWGLRTSDPDNSQFYWVDNVIVRKFAAYNYEPTTVVSGTENVIPATTSYDAAFYQAQVIEDGGSWISPAWDSTKLATSITGGERQEIVYGSSTLPIDGTTYYHRWRFWDTEGNTSPWTDGLDLWTMATSSYPINLSIVGTSSAETNITHMFDITANDPNSDDIRYGIDWDQDGSINEWLPASGYVGTGVQQTASRSWPTAGDASFDVVAEDEFGLRSATSTHALTLFTGGSNTPPQALIQTPPPGGNTSPVYLTGFFEDSADGDAFDGYEWYEGTCESGTLLDSSTGAQANNPTLPYEYALGDGTYDIFFRVKDDRGAWSSCDQINISLPAICGDGEDNDGDNRIDYPNDPGCDDANDDNEGDESQCQNNFDDDGDGFCDGVGSSCQDGSIGGDPSCYSGQSTSSGSYIPGGPEGGCGDLICKDSESFGTCPKDCSIFWRFQMY